MHAERSRDAKDCDPKRLAIRSVASSVSACEAIATIAVPRSEGDGTLAHIGRSAIGRSALVLREVPIESSVRAATCNR
jgi:hypothetical protein